MSVHLLRPEYLICLPLLLGLLWRYQQRRLKRRQAWRSQMDPALFQALVVDSDAQQQPLSRAELAYAALLALVASLAMAGLSWRELPQTSFVDQQPTVFVLDLSRSMLAEDVKPNRLTRAKLLIRQIIDQQQDGQTGLIAFAGAAYLISPLSDDHDTLFNLLEGLHPRLMPAQGADLQQALARATELLGEDGDQAGHIVLLSDSEPDLDAQLFAGELSVRDQRVSVLSVGTAMGAPIPTRDGFLQYQNETVMAATPIEALSALASAGQGAFLQHDVSAAALAQFQSSSAGAGRAKQSQAKRLAWQDGGVYLLVLFTLLILPLLWQRGGR